MATKILIVQTAFIGDVILATSLVEHIKTIYPQSCVDFFCRKGNESILAHNPNINKIHIWDKNKGKLKSLISNILNVRKEKYDYVLNIQRFFNSGLVTTLSGARFKIGFNKNPLSFAFTKSIEHKIPHFESDGHFHEVQRNGQLLKIIRDDIKIPNAKDLKPKIYFNDSDQTTINKLKLSDNYFVMAPSSVWYTKQWHIDKWKELIKTLPSEYEILLIGAPADFNHLEQLQSNNTRNLAGKLNLRESALLMKNATRVFVNDSAPLHLASSVNAKTTAIFCSTVPEFGYGPLSDDSKTIQLEPRLECMPCGLHGHKSCPKGHFDCSQKIDVNLVAKY